MCALNLISYNEKEQNLILKIPFISGFLHNSLSHFVINIILFYLTMLPVCNKRYSVKNIYWITFIISLFYLPISLAGLTLPAIGISGMCFFFLSRFLWGWYHTINFGKIIFIFLFSAELFSIGNFQDGTAHGIHMIGGLLGLVSLNPNMKKYSPKVISKHLYAI